MAHVASLYVYPVKGLASDECSTLLLRPQEGVAGDRVFALAFQDAPMNVSHRAASWLSKKHLAMQHDWPALAAISCRIDAECGVLEIYQKGAAVLRIHLDDEQDLLKADHFFTDLIRTFEPYSKARHPEKLPVRLIGSLAAKTRYPDRNDFDVSILNLASLKDLSEKVGREIDVRRFRGNIILDGLRPWEELEWKDGAIVRCGDVELTLGAQIGRCANINVDPDTTESDAEILKAVAKSPARGTFGVLATVRSGGVLTRSDSWHLVGI